MTAAKLEKSLWPRLPTIGDYVDLDALYDMDETESAFYEAKKRGATREDRKMHKLMTVEMPDGSKWGVPVALIARNRATHYASEFGGDVERSLAEDTLPLFEESGYEIVDWAKNQMNWSDFDGHQVKVSDASPPDFQEAWMNGETGFFDV